MANKLMTVFQTLDSAINGKWDKSSSIQPHINSYNVGKDSDILFKTDDKIEYAKTKLELQQNAYLKDRWVRANMDLSVQAFNGLNNLKLMYRDADLMDQFPEIGAALSILSEEATVLNDHGSVLNIYSKSERIKSILEDLFVNRLDIQTMSQMIIRAMCKYGNQFMLLNIDNKNGVMGWRQLPVYNVERLENGISNPYGTGGIWMQQNAKKDGDSSTQFIWTDDNNGQVPFRNWQIGHFRLINNSKFLPYGVSFLEPARRHFLMLSRMEDMMLLYRLERSIERRVYKIFVGAIDDADVPAYVQEVANNFKRTPLIDPQTGQIDLRKNLLPVHKDTPIPLLDGRTISIEELSKETKSGKINLVYSIQDGTRRVVPGKVVWCDKNYTAEKLYKLTLDNNTFCIMAGEHEVLMHDGTKKRADELCKGESIMSFQGIGYNESDKRNLKSIEIVDGCDVYCMTVVGIYGEEDRHNFALKTWAADSSISPNGIFVSNCTDSDIFIPTRSESAPNPIDTLSAAQNLTAMDDIKFVQNKVLTALQIPKSFLNFEDATGDGKNLALMDIRFTRTVNRVQQAFLMELNKIASIHLFLLGFTDDLTNFSLSMNNPSTQAEQLQIETVQKKIAALRDAVSDPGTGIPAMSMQRALREIMKWSDNEIQENFEEIRLEKALAAELEKTSQIIKQTGIFDSVDRMYGEPGAKYQDEAQGGQEGGDDGMGGMPGGGGGGLDMSGDDLGDLGGPGAGEDGAIAGVEGEMPMDMAANDMGGTEGQDIPMENILLRKPILLESKRNEKFKATYKRADIYDKTLMINEEFSKMLTSLNEFTQDKKNSETIIE